MQIIKYNTREHKLILRVFAHSSKVEKKVMMNVANAINKLKEEDWKGKGVYPIEIPMHDLMDRTECNYESIKRVCKKIMSKIIYMEIPYKLKTTGKTEIFKSHVCVFPECGISENTFRIEVKETVLPLFSRALEIYRHYNVIEAKFLTHKHSIELYKFLKDKLNQDKNEFTVTIEDLKKELGLEDKYKLYADFKRRVIEPAYKDMKKNGVIWFEFKEHKRSRSVTHLDFFIHSNDNKKKELNVKMYLNKYIDTIPSEQFKKDFKAFLHDSDYCKTSEGKRLNLRLEARLKELEEYKHNLTDWDKNTQIDFIDWIAGDELFQ